MANFNLIGQNLRGLTVTFTFKDLEAFPSTENTIKLLRVGAYEISDYFIDVNASLIYDNADGTGYYYYDDVRFNNNTLSVDATQLDPVTYTFPDDMDYYVYEHNSEYVSCNLTEDDLYTTISGKWEITNPHNLTIPNALTEQVNFTSNTSTYNHMYMVYRGYTWVEYHNIVDGEYENISTIIYTNSEGLPAFNESYRVIDFGAIPQKVTKYFVRCLKTIAVPLDISGVWKFKGKSYCHSSNFNDFKEPVNFTANGYNFAGIAFYDLASEVQVSYVEADDTELEVMWHVGDVEPVAALTEYYTVDFGTAPQNVSAEFMTFMEAMADPVKAISGKWELTDLTALATVTNTITQEVNFTTAAYAYNTLEMTSSYIEAQHIVNGDYEQISSLGTLIDGINNINIFDIDFGAEVQYVSSEFFEIFDKIADPVEAPMTKVKGKWKLIPSISTSVGAPTLNPTYQEVKFTSNSEAFTGLTITLYPDLCETFYHKQDGSSVAVVEGWPYVNETWNEEYSIIDFGSKPQEVTEEFYDAFKTIAQPLQISGVWKFKANITTTPAHDLTERVNYTVKSGIEWLVGDRIEFSTYSNFPCVRLESNEYTNNSVHEFAVFEGNVYIEHVDFGDDPQQVSEDFLLWMNHMAEPWSKVSGMWILNNSINASLILPKTSFSEAVNFKHDLNDSCTALNISYSTAMGTRLSYTSQEGSTTAYEKMSGGSTLGWQSEYFRYLQFGETQYVSPLFEEFLEKNAINVGECAIEPGNYCFKLNIFEELSSLQPTEGSTTIPLRYTHIAHNSDGSDADEGYEISVNRYGAEYLTLEFTNGRFGYEYSSDSPKMFRAFGWHPEEDEGSFENRLICVLEKTYLAYSDYQFLTSTLIQLNSQRFLDTLGVWETAQSMKTITDLTAKYAKYTRYTPVADVLYHNESGIATVTGLDLSKYLYVTVRGRASSRFIAPMSTAFAVKNIDDCGGTMELQLANPYNYCVWNVTKTSFTPTSYGSGSGYLIYEIIGYRYEASLDTIPEKDTPTYAYQYVRGQLSCPSGKYFNNFYNYDQGTEFRVELNFRLSSLGVELASNTASANNNWKLSVNENGNLVMNNTYDGTAATPAVWTEFTIQPNVWYSLSLYSNNLTSTNYTSTKGQVNVSIVSFSTNPSHSYVMKKINKWSQFSTTRSLYVGGDNVELRDRILVKGTKYHSGVTNTQSVLDVDVDNAAIGGTLSLTSGSFTLSGGLVYGAEE